jgi:hypothetical protein
MQHLRRIRHYGLVTYASWFFIGTALAMLAGFAVWSS